MLKTMRILRRVTTRLPEPWRRVIDWVVTIAVAVVFVLTFEAEVAKPYRIPSSSMEPTLHCARPQPYCRAQFSDRVLVNRLAYRFGGPKRGQIVVFKTKPRGAECGDGRGGSIFVKRLIGLPRETVSEQDGYVAIDGKRLREPYIQPRFRDHQSGTWKVPGGHYFFLGDNRARSCDSRMWGSVPRSSLIGPVIITYWPPNRISLH
jgi:signal peptidase I